MKKQDIIDLIAILEGVIEELKMIAAEAGDKAVPINTFKLQQALKQIKKDQDNRAEKIIDLIKQRQKDREDKQ